MPPSMPRLLVRDWMTPNPITVHPQSTLPHARKLMEKHRIRRLPVMEGDELVGIVTLGDIREAQPSDVRALHRYEMENLIELITVDAVMTPRPWTVSVDSTIAQAAALMLKHKIGGLPVMDGDRLAGIITETDFCRLLAQA